MAALDVPENQIAVDFDDSEHPWHMRLLLARVPDTSKWVALSPNWELEVVDLNDHTVVPLARAAKFPSCMASDCTPLGVSTRTNPHGCGRRRARF